MRRATKKENRAGPIVRINSRGRVAITRRTDADRKGRRREEEKERGSTPQCAAYLQCFSAIARHTDMHRVRCIKYRSVLCALLESIYVAKRSERVPRHALPHAEAYRTNSPRYVPCSPDCALLFRDPAREKYLAFTRMKLAFSFSPSVYPFSNAHILISQHAIGCVNSPAAELKETQSDYTWVSSGGTLANKVVFLNRKIYFYASFRKKKKLEWFTKSFASSLNALVKIWHTTIQILFHLKNVIFRNHSLFTVFTKGTLIIGLAFMEWLRFNHRVN